jgi:hypothetical protein
MNTCPPFMEIGVFEGFEESSTFIHMSTGESIQTVYRQRWSTSRSYGEANNVFEKE